MLPGLGTLPDIGEQRALLGVSDISAKPAEVEGEVANPVAHVHVVAKQPHLDRIFDYLIPARFDEKAQVGVRVEVPLGSRTVSGFIISRDSQTYQGATLRDIKRVVSPVPVLSESLYDFLGSVARAYGVGVSELFPLAIPERHARAEKEFFEKEDVSVPVSRACDDEMWQLYVGGMNFCEDVSAGKAPHAACCALAGQAGGNELLASLIARTRANDKSVIALSPTVRSASALAESLEKRLREPVALMLGESSPQRRYDTFLNVLHGRRRIIVGTRNALWAPARDVGLVIVIDDCSPHLREVRSPYFHARDVARMRALHEKAAFLCFSPYVSEESAALIASKEAVLLEGSNHAVTQYVPRVSSSQQWRGGEGDSSRLPEAVFALVREALESGPVLFVVPRSGYIPVVACQTCRESALCTVCGGVLQIDNPTAPASCTRCGTSFPDYRCSQCGGSELRAARIGSMRTAQEIARAFPGKPIVVSSASDPEGIQTRVDSRPRIVIATPGAEPSAQGGFAAAVVLDSRFLRGQGAGADMNFIRTLTRIAVRVRPRGRGGHLMIVGSVDSGLIAALASWKLADFAARLLEERESLQLPPAATWVSLNGTIHDLRRFLGLCKSYLIRQDMDGDNTPSTENDIFLSGGISTLYGQVDIIGSTEGRKEGEIGLYLRCPRSFRAILAGCLAASRNEYSALNLGSPIRIEFDPEL